MDRDTELVDVAKRFLQVHDAWAASPDATLTEGYEQAADILFRAFEDGDLPEQCRSLAGAVDYARAQWQSFQGYRSLLKPLPREAWWVAVEQIMKAVSAADVDEDRPLEPVAMLLKQGVGVSQIANHIYGHHGTGPFLKNGVPQPHLVYQEGEKPGSVLGADWVHPSEQARRDQREAALKQRISQTRALSRKHADAPESLEDLLQQGVSFKQIAQMKGVSMEAVAAKARELGLEVEPQTNPIPVPGQQTDQLPADADSDGDGDGDGDEDDGDDDSEDSPDDTLPAEPLDPMDAQILDLAAQGFGASDIAKHIGCSVQKAAAVIRSAKNRE